MSCLESLEIVGLRPLHSHSSPSQSQPSDVAPPQTVRSPFTPILSPEVRSQYNRYLNDNYRGHQAMRGENGLIMDTVYLRQDGKGKFQVEAYKTGAAPTDIGLDLLVQTGMSDHPQHGPVARASLERVMTALETLPYDRQTGLFHRLYETRTKTSERIIDFDISSVDNLHLAVGLWTAAQKFPEAPIGIRAKKLFERMDFSRFYDPHTQLLGGNLKHRLENGETKWQLEPYRYHFGSEARSVYTLGYALELFRAHPGGAVIESALKKIPIELGRSGNRDHLRVWNGGIFQQLLPRSLANEELYSTMMSASARNTSNYMLLDGPYLSNSDGTGFRIPAGSTAGVTAIKNSAQGKLDIIYSGELGAKHLKETANPNTMDDSAVAFHALLLGAAVNPGTYAPRLAQTEGLKYGTDRAYLAGFGWVDSATVVTPGGAKTVARPNSAGVGVDKGIELLALLQILDSRGLSVSGSALAENPNTALRLKSAFKIIDQRWEASRKKTTDAPQP